MPCPISPAPMTASRISAALPSGKRHPLKRVRRGCPKFQARCGHRSDDGRHRRHDPALRSDQRLHHRTLCRPPRDPGTKGIQSKERRRPRARLDAFLAILFVPAMLSGFVFTVRNPADWAIFAVAMAVAILYDYYRLNPEKVPWVRARA